MQVSCRRSLMLFTIILLTFAVIPSVAGQDDTGKSARQYYEEGAALMRDGKVGEAIDSFEIAREMAPENPQIYNTLGIAYLQNERDIEYAREMFEQATVLKPDFAEAYCNLGITYSGSSEEYYMAEEYYQKALALDPNFSRAYFGLGWLSLVRKDNAHQAVEFFSRSVDLNPKYQEAVFYLGMSYVMNGESHKALGPISQLRSMGKEDMAKTLEALLEATPEEMKMFFGGGGA